MNDMKWYGGNNITALDMVHLNQLQWNLSQAATQK